MFCHGRRSRYGNWSWRGVGEPPTWTSSQSNKFLASPITDTTPFEPRQNVRWGAQWDALPVLQHAVENSGAQTAVVVLVWLHMRKLGALLRRSSRLKCLSSSSSLSSSFFFRLIPILPAHHSIAEAQQSHFLDGCCCFRCCSWCRGLVYEQSSYIARQGKRGVGTKHAERRTRNIN